MKLVEISSSLAEAFDLLCANFFTDDKAVRRFLLANDKIGVLSLNEIIGRNLRLAIFKGRRVKIKV